MVILVEPGYSIKEQTYERPEENIVAVSSDNKKTYVRVEQTSSLSVLIQTVQVHADSRTVRCKVF